MKNYIVETRFLLMAISFALAGCGTFYKDAASIGNPDPGKVIVVGKIELVPPLKPGEQKIRTGFIDPMDWKGLYTNRALLHLASEPMTREKTFEAINPRLEETFFSQIPREKRYVVDAGVMMSSTSSPLGVELRFPTPMEFEIRPTDTAVYIGTIRVHRDEFNSVTKMELIDQSGAAAAEFRSRYGSDAVFRKAPIKQVRLSEKR